MNEPERSGETHASGEASAASFRDELERLHTASFGWALLCCDRNVDLAADALQTAYVRALSGQARFRGDANIKTWFFGIIRMVSREQRRKGKPMEIVSADATPPERNTPPNAVHTHAREEAMHLLDAMKLLSDRQREVLHLVFYEEFSLRDAAALLGIGFGAASTHYDRGKKALLETLRARGVKR